MAIGGWLPSEGDLSLRRDQPGYFTGFEKNIDAEELYGPAGEWTVDAWLDRKWRERHGERPRHTTGEQQPIEVGPRGQTCGVQVTQ